MTPAAASLPLTAYLATGPPALEAATAVTVEAPPYPLFRLHAEIVREELPGTAVVYEYAIHAVREGSCAECGFVFAPVTIDYRPLVNEARSASSIGSTSTRLGNRDARGKKVRSIFTSPPGQRRQFVNSRRRDPMHGTFERVAERLGSMGEEAERARWIVRAAAKAGLVRGCSYERLTEAAVVIAARERKRYVALSEVTGRTWTRAGHGPVPPAATTASTTAAQRPPRPTMPQAPAETLTRICRKLHIKAPHLTAVEILWSVAKRGRWADPINELPPIELLPGQRRRHRATLTFSVRTVKAARAILERFEADHPYATRQPAVMAAAAVYVAGMREEGRDTVKTGKTQPALGRAFNVTEVSVRSAARELVQGRAE